MPSAIPVQHKRAAAFVSNLKVPTSRREIPDAAKPGLYLIVQPVSGALSWAVRTKVDGRPVKITIGVYDALGSPEDRLGAVISPKQALSITQARNLADRVIGDARRGRDPRKAKTDADRYGLDYWFEEFITTAKTKGFKKGPVKATTAAEYERIIETLIKPNWTHISDIRTINHHDVEKLIDKINPGARRNAFAVLSAFFRWRKIARIVGQNIVGLVEAPPKPQSRERVLTHDEIRAVWNAAEQCGYPFGPLVQLLLLTGQRRDEIANLKWNEISADVITLEGSRTKNGSAHIVPIAPFVRTIIDNLPKIADRRGNASEYVFTTNGEKPFSGFSNGKNALDKHCGEMADWHLHDLRRTCATELAKIGILQEVTEGILNHKTGKVSGVAAVYNRYEYQSEKRDALEKWTTHVQAITANNIELLRERA